MRNAKACQNVHHNRCRFSLMLFQKQPQETLCSRAITTRLGKHIDHIAILVARPSQMLLFASYLYKNFVDLESIAEFLVPFLQSFGIFRSEIVAPQTNRFIAYGSTTLSE